MLIAMYHFFMEVALPQLVFLAQELVDPILKILLVLTAIVIIFAAAGLKISNNLGSTVVNGIFRAIAYITRTIFQAIGWIIRTVFSLIPRVFVGSRRALSQIGLNALLSNLLGFVITLLVIAIII